jgi:pentatricopeptide repeat protein
MASAALRLNPKLRHHRLLLSRLYSATPVPQSEPPPASSNRIERLKNAIRRETDPDRIASLFLSAGSKSYFHGDREIYFSTIRRLASSRRNDLIESLLSSSLASFPSPSEGFLIRILTLYSKSGMMDHAVRTFNQIKSVIDRSFSALLSAYFDNKQFDQLHKAFNTLPIELGFSPGTASYNVFHKCLSSEGKVNTARVVLDEMPKKELSRISFPTMRYWMVTSRKVMKQGLTSSWNWFIEGVRPNMTTYNLRIQLLCNKGNSLQAEELLEVMISNGINPNIVTFNTIIDGFCKKRAGWFSLESFKKITEVQLENGASITPNLVTYNVLIKGLVEKEEFLPAVEVYKEFAKKNCALSLQAVRKLVEGLLNLSQEEEAKKVVSSVRKVVTGTAVDEWKKIEPSFSFWFLLLSN